MFAVGVDSGTQGTKVVIVKFSGQVVGKGYARHHSVQGLKPGESEQEPLTWLEAMEKALAQALKGSGIEANRIAALGISGQQHGFVPLDKQGHPIRPAKLWNDTSTVEETEYLIDKLGGKDRTIAKMGICLAVGYTASKILWLKRHEPENFAKLSTILLPHNFLNFVLTGKRHMEYGDASGTGLMDIRKREWFEEAVSAVDPCLKEKLPALSHPAEPVGQINDDFARRFGLGKVLVSSGGGDNMMGAIGSGNVVPGVCTLSLGTSGTIYSHFDSPFIDPQGEIAAFCGSTGGWLPLLCTMNVTNTSERFKELFDLTNEELEGLGSKSPSGAGGLLFLPFIGGERVPVLPSACGVLYGLNGENFKSTHFARSIMEGTIFNLGYGFGRMQELGLQPEQIRATGGGAKSKLWQQIVADIFQTPVITLQEEEAAALGAAIQAIWSYEMNRGQKVHIGDLTDLIVKTKNFTVEPNPENFPLYKQLQKKFNTLWQTLFSGPDL